MKNEKILAVIGLGLIGVILINVSIGLIRTGCIGVRNLSETIKFNKEIKKGLKDGSIIEIDGKYYESRKLTVEEVN
jgi:hypothetical protein